MLAFRLARRELRGGVRGLWIVLLCLALGVAVIAAVGSLRAATDRGLAEDGRRILGGDLEVESGSQPLPDALRDWLRARGATLSDVVQTRSMLVAPSGERQLVELKVVDAAWPLVGEAGVAADPQGPLPLPPSRKGRGSSGSGITPPPLAGGGQGEGAQPDGPIAAARPATACSLNPSSWTASTCIPAISFAWAMQASPFAEPWSPNQTASLLP